MFFYIVFTIAGKKHDVFNFQEVLEKCRMIGCKKGRIPFFNVSYNGSF